MHAEFKLHLNLSECACGIAFNLLRSVACLRSLCQRRSVRASYLVSASWPHVNTHTYRAGGFVCAHVRIALLVINVCVKKSYL
jgi:hypothetical protein